MWRLAMCCVMGVLLSSCGGGDDDGVDSGVMQALHIVAGNGGYAYFQLMWPQVEVAQNPGANAAVIEPASAGHLFAADGKGNREWLATSFAPWIDSHGDPMKGMEISAFLSGSNETHTSSPSSGYVLSSGSSNIAGIAAYQASHATFVAPLVQAGTGSVGTAPGAPAVTAVASAAELITLYQTLAGVDLTPTADEEAEFRIDADPALADFGRRLIVAAKAFRRGLSGTIVVSFPGDDPHGAFNNLPALKARLEVIKAQLNGFHSLLRSSADHVLITINGDTPKNPLNNQGWGDGTPSNANWIFVVGKGYLKQGWFGRIHADGTVSTFDPATGNDAVQNAGRKVFSAAAIAYAGTRGDTAFLSDALGVGELSTYAGLVVAK